MKSKTLIKIVLEGISLSLIIWVTQLYVFPQMGLLSPSVDGVAGAAFATFVVYTGMSIMHRSRDEKA